MTISAIDYRSGSAAAPAPVLSGALLTVLSFVLVWQSILGAMAVYPAVDFLPWRVGVWAVFGAIAVGLPILSGVAFVTLRSGTPSAAAAMGRFLRLSTYALALSFLATIHLESAHLSGQSAYVLTALRGGIEAGLLIAVYQSVLHSRTVRQTCGRTFPARVADAVLRMVAADGAIVIVLMLAALVLVLAYSAVPAVRQYGFKFLTSTDWRPNELERPIRDAAGHIQYDSDGDEITQTIPPSFGALPVMYGTIISSALALGCAVPLSLGAALFLVRIVPWVPGAVPRALLSGVSFLIEFLAAIPSIAYGIWGLFVLSPFLANYLEPPLNRFFGAVPFLRWLHTDGMPSGRDMLCGGIVLAIMILPIITAVSRDVLASVPRTQIEGTQALGATWWQSSWAMLRYGKSGLFGAVMLGLARAAGETMAVAMVIGNSNQIRASWFAPAQTMASLLANEFAEASSDEHRGALVEVALLLLAMSLTFNIIARWLVVGRTKTVTA